MKKLISFMLVVFLLSGCSLLMPQSNAQKTKQFKTNNGSLILINKKDTTVFCSKQNVDELLNKVEQHSIEEEFSVNKYNTLSYKEIKERYQIIINDNKSCQYQNYYLDFTSKENFVVLDEIEINDSDNINIESLAIKDIFEDFLKRQPQNVNEVLLNKLLKEVGMDAIIKEDFSIDGAGTYQLIAQPLFRMYYLEDNKKVYDYNFSTIIGFNLKLVKK